MLFNLKSALGKLIRKALWANKVGVSMILKSTVLLVCVPVLKIEIHVSNCSWYPVII
jgi:hypothetical protein